MFRRSAHKLAACTPILQAIISGTASIGWKIRSRIAPATAENAKPARLETKAGDKGTGEHGDAQQEIGRQIRHVFGPLDKSTS